MGGEQLYGVMVDGGSAINLMPKRMLAQLGIRASRLQQTHYIIQGFNQNEQNAPWERSDRRPATSDNIHCLVIDVDTSYNTLLGHPQMGFPALLYFTSGKSHQPSSNITHIIDSLSRAAETFLERPQPT